MRAIEERGHQPHQPDALIGYGVPDARLADSRLANKIGVKPATEALKLKMYPNPVNDQITIDN